MSRPPNDHRKDHHRPGLSGGRASRHDAMAIVARSVSPRGTLLDAAGMAAAGSGAAAVVDVRGSAAAQGPGRALVRRADFQPEAEEPLPSSAPGAADRGVRYCRRRLQGADVLYLYGDAWRSAGALFGLGLARFRRGW